MAADDCAHYRYPVLALLAGSDRKNKVDQYSSLTGCPPGSWDDLTKAYTYIPKVDLFGNSATASAYAEITDDSSKIIFSAGNSDADSINAADDAAHQIRNDGIIIYTIGLDGDGGFDGKLLERVANDPTYRTPASLRSLPPSLLPNVGQLGAAFNSIASEILRISQ